MRWTESPATCNRADAFCQPLLTTAQPVFVSMALHLPFIGPSRRRFALRTGRRSLAACLLAVLLLAFGACVPLQAADQGRFVVVLDPAHGGTNTGARINDHLLEKDLVLTLAGDLRTRLAAQKIDVITTRSSDVTLSATDRAQIANRAGAQACISLHATTSGTGIHLFTSSLAPVPLIRFLPWDTAQGAYVQQSLRLSSEIDTAFTREQIPLILGRTALEPMDSFTCPAAAVEAAPLVRSGRVTPLSDSGYQQRIVEALASAIEQWRQDYGRNTTPQGGSAH